MSSSQLTKSIIFQRGWLKRSPDGCDVCSSAMRKMKLFEGLDSFEITETRCFKVLRLVTSCDHVKHVSWPHYLLFRACLLGEFSSHHRLSLLLVSSSGSSQFMNYAIIRFDVNHLLDLISPEQAWARPSTNYHSYLMSNLVFVLIEILPVESRNSLFILTSGWVKTYYCHIWNTHPFTINSEVSRCTYTGAFYAGNFREWNDP